MNAQLQILIALQDILFLIREAKDPTQKKALDKIGLRMDNLTSLESTRTDLEGQLRLSILGEYNRVRQRYGRIVAPVINGICYGCFVKIPSAIESSEDRNDSLHRCENCGMFLYWVER
jgi:predicted  nucleic acid-binding Zn-ribbon protein